LGVQAGVLGERRLQQLVRPAQFGKGLDALLLLLLRQPDDPGGAAQHDDVDDHDGHGDRQTGSGRLGHIGRLRGIGHDRDGAGEPMFGTPAAS
jgi:hypothetical protein